METGPPGDQPGEGGWFLQLRALVTSPAAKNLGSLYVLQLLNYLFPLITLPYLARAIGPAPLGTVAFGLGLIGYFQLIVNYGFDWSATRRVASAIGDHPLLNGIATNTWMAKLLLWVVGLVLLLVITRSVPELSANRTLNLLLYGSVAGSVLTPNWLFLGFERMRDLAIILVVGRLASLTLMILTVHSPDHVLRYAAILSGTNIATGAAAVLWAGYALHVRPTMPHFSEIFTALSDGLSLFLASTLTSLYTVGNVFLVGLLAGPAAAGYYYGAERIVVGARGLIVPISQVVFPRVARLAPVDREKALTYLARPTLLLAAVGLLLSAALWLLADPLVHFMLGPEFAESAGVLRISCWVVANVALATAWSTLTMLAFKRDRAVLAIVGSAGFINLALAILLIPGLQGSGMAIAYLVSEGFVNVASLTYVSIHGLRPRLLGHSGSAARGKEE